MSGPASGEVARGPSHLAEQLGELGFLLGREPDEAELDGRHGFRGLLPQRRARLGDLHEGGAPVGRVRHAAYEAVGLEPVDDVGHARGVELEPLTHRAHRQPAAAGEREQHQRLVARERQAVRAQRAVHRREEDLLHPHHARDGRHRPRGADPPLPQRRRPHDRGRTPAARARS